MPFDKLLHGGDYNPEQWLDRPDILEKDIEYFKKAKINTVSVGMFSWAMLEPEEGNYQFDWLEKVIDSLYAEGISIQRKSGRDRPQAGRKVRKASGCDSVAYLQ